MNRAHISKGIYELNDDTIYFKFFILSGYKASVYNYKHLKAFPLP